MVSISNLRKSIEQYNPFDEQEEKDKQVTLDFIDTFDDVLTRNNKFGHFSASAFVVTEDLTKALFVHHNIFNGFVCPGGHADGEADLLSVAKREVYEETGITAELLLGNNIFAIQAIAINGHVKRGQYVSSHTHYDILYLLVVKNSEIDKIRILESENSKVEWFDLDNLNHPAMLDWFQPILDKILKKLRKTF